MTAKIFYFKDAVPSGATLHRSLQDGGTAPTAATTSTGWTAGTNAAGQSCVQNGGSKVARTSGQWGSALQPSAAPSDAIGDCWRSENLINGKFANADWTLTFRILSAASAYTGRFKLGVRIWRSADPTGAGAVEITSGRITSAATTADLSTSMVLSLPVTFTPGTEITLNNEYLFVSVGLEITSAGSGNLQDMLFRVSSSALITTSSFSNIFNTSGALPGQGSAVNGSATRFRTHSASVALAGIGSRLSGNSAKYRAHAANGVLIGKNSALSGLSVRYRQHNSTGALSGNGSAVAGSSNISLPAIPSGYFVIALYRFTPVIELSRNKPTILMTKSNPTIRLKAA
ncbi:hypothetical protein Nit79A3_1453 [Nitrosomonas sp. Is79A3]|uniref:hypothetical protein n=1 Tax=Nitrosomonas sp. (strain Is79A3) TaxID=261292 RepID=UPI000215D0CB